MQDCFGTVVSRPCELTKCFRPSPCQILHLPNSSASGQSGTQKTCFPITRSWRRHETRLTPPGSGQIYESLGKVNEGGLQECIAVISRRRKAWRRRQTLDSDLQLIAGDVPPAHWGFQALEGHEDTKAKTKVREESWVMSGAQPMAEEPPEPTRGNSWFRLPMPALARTSLSSTLSRPGRDTPLRSHPLVRTSPGPSPTRKSSRRGSGRVSRVVSKSSSRLPSRAISPSSRPIQRPVWDSDSESLGSLSTEAERHLAVGRGTSPSSERSHDQNI
jgi:hypothetical protein